MYKKNVIKRKFNREIETAFYEARYLFLIIFLIILFYNFI